jgi:hypothetical protein
MCESSITLYMPSKITEKGIRKAEKGGMESGRILTFFVELVAVEAYN